MTPFDGDEGGPVPTVFVAVTTNVYVVPLVSPVKVAEVAGGDPATVVEPCATAPAYEVTV